MSDRRPPERLSGIRTTRVNNEQDDLPVLPRMIADALDGLATLQAAAPGRRYGIKFTANGPLYEDVTNGTPDVDIRPLDLLADFVPIGTPLSPTRGSSGIRTVSVNPRRPIRRLPK